MCHNSLIFKAPASGIVGALFKIAMRHPATGLLLFISLVVGLLSLSVLSWADNSDDSPQWCTQAKTKVEILICENGQLDDYDRELTAYYEALLKAVEPSTQSDLVQSQKKWIAERERCSATARSAEALVHCVDTKIGQRLDFLRKSLQEKIAEKRALEFAKFQLKTYKDDGFEFQYPDSWHLEMAEDGRISLNSDPEEGMSLGFEKTISDPKKCSYEEQGTSEDEVRKFFYQGKMRTGGQEFDVLYRSWIPSGYERHYYGFVNGRCFSIHIGDESHSSRKCGGIDDGKDKADCEMAELEAKDLMAYSDGVIRTIRFLHNQK